MTLRIFQYGYKILGWIVWLATIAGLTSDSVGAWLLKLLPFLAEYRWAAVVFLVITTIAITHDFLSWKLDRKAKAAANPKPNMTFREMFDYLRLKAKVSLECRDWKDWIATVPELVEDELALGQIQSWGRVQRGWQAPRPTLQPIKTDVWRGGSIDPDTCWAHSDEVSPRTVSMVNAGMPYRSFYYDDLRTNSYQVKLIWPPATLIEKYMLGFKFVVFKRDGFYYDIC